jgi:hypothetical protein
MQHHHSDNIIEYGNLACTLPASTKRDNLFLAILRAILYLGNASLSPRDISNQIKALGMTNNSPNTFSGLHYIGGLTPHATVSARLSNHFKQYGSKKALIERVRNDEGKNGYRIRPSCVSTLMGHDQDDEDDCVTETPNEQEEEEMEEETIPTFSPNDIVLPASPLVTDTILFSTVEWREESCETEKLSIDTSYYYDRFTYSLPTPITPPYTTEFLHSPPASTTGFDFDDEEVDRYLDISEENSVQTRLTYPAKVIERFAYIKKESLFLVSTIHETENPMYASSVGDVEFYVMWVDKLPIIRLASRGMVNAMMLLSICGVKENEEEMMISCEGNVVNVADGGVLDGSYIPLKRALEFASTFSCLDRLRVFLSEGLGELFEDGNEVGEA